MLNEKQWVRLLDDVIRLTNQEIQHIVGLLGRDDLFGVNDGFYGMTDHEIAAAVRESEDQLLQKGYILMDFDGNITVREDIAEQIRICADCDKCLEIQMLCVNRSVKRTIYSKDGKYVQFEELGTAYLIRFCDPQRVLQELTADLCWISCSEELSGRFSIAQRVLAQAKDDYLRAGSILMEVCKNKTVANILSSGLRRSSNYYSFLLLDFSGAGETLDVFGLTVLNSFDGSLAIDDQKNDGGSLVFAPITLEGVKEKLLQLFTML